MGFGLHDNGLDPKAAIEITNLIITSKLLSGLKATVISNTDLLKLDKFFHGLLKQIQGLPDNTAREAVYILAGELPIVEKLEIQILELFGSITRLSHCNVLHRLAVRQITTKSESSKSWFIKAQKISTKYGIDASSTLIQPWPQATWKRKCKDNAWKTTYNVLYDSAKTKSTLAWMILKNPSKPHKIHEIWETCLGSPHQAIAARLRAKLLVGRYALNKLRAKYRPGLNPRCPLCHQHDEDTVHFIAVCAITRHLVAENLVELRNLYSKTGLPSPHGPDETTSAVLNGHQFAMKHDLGSYCIDDTLAVQLVGNTDITISNRLTNEVVRKLHNFREDAIKKDKDNCIECLRKVTGDDPALSCDGCLRWQHIECNDMVSEEQYDRFIATHAILEWYCQSCSRT